MKNNMYVAPVFVHDIIVDVLGLNITSAEYEELFGDRNLFYYFIRRNIKYINDTCF